MVGPDPHYVLFDNAALNYISGQPQHGSQLSDADRQRLIDVVRSAVAAGRMVVLTNIAALGELSLWFARGYVVARLREIFGEGRKATDGGDLYDNIYFEDAAYSDVFVTGDGILARRGRSLRLASARILLTEEWVGEILIARLSSA